MSNGTLRMQMMGVAIIASCTLCEVMSSTTPNQGYSPCHTLATQMVVAALPFDLPATPLTNCQPKLRCDPKHPSTLTSTLSYARGKCDQRCP